MVIRSIIKKLKMMKRINFTTVITFSLCSILFSLAYTTNIIAIKPENNQVSASVKKAMEQIRPESIRAHTAFLSDDQLEGRRTGTRGYMLAANYIRSQCEVYGLSGAAENKTYFQKVPFVRTIVLPNESSLILTKGNEKRSLNYNKDFVILDTHRETEGSISGDLVFVGFGVTAPEEGYDDYRGLDVKGKIVVMIMMAAPPTFPSAVRAYYSNPDIKRANAAAHGAEGIIYIRLPNWKWSSLLRAISIGWNTLRWLDVNGKPNGMKDTLKIVAVLNESGARVMFASENHSLEDLFAGVDKGTLKGFSLSTHADMTFKSQHEKVEGDNVIALLEGSDPVLKKEYVVYSAHLDHLGIGTAVNGDSIFNGAIDNAGGCAVLLELMKAFSTLSEKPKRSIVFLFTTAEECGLLGSDYFANYPTIPLKQIVSVLNVDEPMSLGPVSDVIGYGSEHSSLGTTIQLTAGKTGFTVSPDPYPEEGFFARTDVFPLVKKGIPSVWITVGTKSTQQGIDGLAVQKNWMVTNYHSPKDDISQPIDFETEAKFNRFLFLLGYQVANNTDRPVWNKNDFFGDKFE